MYKRKHNAKGTITRTNASNTEKKCNILKKIFRFFFLVLVFVFVFVFVLVLFLAKEAPTKNQIDISSPS